MSDKVKLQITLKELKAAPKVILQEQYKIALSGQEPDAALTNKQLLEAILAAADPAEPLPPVPKQPKAPDGDSFNFEGKVYKVNTDKFKRVNIPALGKRTALEILADPQAQEYLVKHNCIGTVISEVTE